MKLSSFKIFLFLKSLKNKRLVILLIAIFIAIFCLPQISSLAHYQISRGEYFKKIQNIVSLNSKPKVETIKIYVTAYSSSPDETSGDPCIAASGYNLCLHNKENVVAANFLEFGTRVKFPELDPEKFYTVVDRMHERYDSRIDIWMTSKEKAKKFGIKYLTVEIYKE